MPDLSHSVMSPTSFRAEYRRSGSASMFSRSVRLQVDIAPVHKEDSISSDSASMSSGQQPQQIHCLTFTLLSGKLQPIHCLVFILHSSNWLADENVIQISILDILLSRF